MALKLHTLALASILQFAVILQALAEEPRFVPLFNGKDLGVDTGIEMRKPKIQLQLGISKEQTRQ